jgi:hypothetical protein
LQQFCPQDQRLLQRFGGQLHRVDLQVQAVAGGDGVFARHVAGKESLTTTQLEHGLGRSLTWQGRQRLHRRSKDSRAVHAVAGQHHGLVVAAALTLLPSVQERKTTFLGLVKVMALLTAAGFFCRNQPFAAQRTDQRHGWATPSRL